MRRIAVQNPVVAIRLMHGDLRPATRAGGESSEQVDLPASADEVWLFYSGARFGATGGGQRPARLAFSAWRASGATVVSLHASLGDPPVLRESLGVFYGHPSVVVEAAGKVKADLRVAVFHITHEPAVQTAERLRERGWTIVYDHLDDWEGFEREWPGSAMWWSGGRERRMVEAAHLVTASSRWLVRYLAEHHRVEAMLLPNATNLLPPVTADVWPLANRPTPSDAPEPPYAVFVGHVGAWVDLRWTGEFARLLDRAGGRLLVIGSGNVHSIPNATSLSTRDVDEIARYILPASGGVVAFKKTTVAAAVDPIKWYDYRACGCRVVATNLPELRRRRHTLLDATPREAVEYLMVEPERKYWPSPSWYARNSWTARFQKLREAVLCLQ